MRALDRGGTPPDPEMRESRPGGAASSESLAAIEHRRWGSPYRRPNGRESTIGRMVRYAILQAGGTVRS
jgi:hypothetical protein